MFTEKPPFSNFKEVASAMFHIGMLKEPPELPASISSEAKDFLLKCLNPDPKVRATAQQLLKHPFVNNQGGIDNVVQFVFLFLLPPFRSPDPDPAPAPDPDPAPDVGVC